MTTAAIDERTAWFGERHDAILANAKTVIKGKDHILALCLTALFAEGHLLIEDVPGVGKTSMAKAIAGSIAATWQRVQFTPDLLPSDITGVSIWNQGRQAFEFRAGPVFANVVLADEINRASPKTQSALLEVMEEQQVTVDGAAHLVPRPFVVIATQNPVDLDGTYRLPEAQLDRFLMRTAVGYPDEDAEVEVVAAKGPTASGPVPAVLSPDDVRTMIGIAARVHVAPAVQRYVVRLVAATRRLPELRMGVSPRGSVALVRASQARAAAQGRAYVLPEDVKALAEAVLAHRMVLTPEAELQGHTPLELLAGLLASLPIPTEDRV